LKDDKEPESAANQPSQPSSSDDWAAAVERWVKGGFKVEDMPAFIRNGADKPQAAEQVDQTVPDITEELKIVGEEKTMLDELVENGAAELKPEVTRLDDIVHSFLDTPAELSSGEATPKSSGSKPEKKQILPSQPARAPEVSQVFEVARPRAKRSIIIRTLGWPPPLAFGLGLLVVGLAALMWRLFLYENPQTISFPTSDIAAEVIPAPLPTDYSAKPKATFHYSRGNRFAHLGRFTEAIAEFQQALREDPDFPHPHRALGGCYAALGEGSLAATSYRNYLKLVPESPDAAQVREILKRYPGR
jgi:tetratricopeptide (TPR) repeat protein